MLCADKLSFVLVDDDEDEIGDGSGPARAFDAFRFDPFARLAQARRVDERDPQAVEIDDLCDEIARRARNVGHDRARRAGERVEQTRLADVGPPDDRDLQAVANQLPAPRAGEQRRRSSGQIVNRPAERSGLDEVISLVREIDRRLEPRDEVEERGVEACDRGRQRPLELIEGGARLERRHRIDQIGDGFGLHQIDPAVEERAKRELAGLGKARAPIDCRFDDRAQDHRASVRAHFDDIVARIGMRSGERRDDNLIDRLCGGGVSRTRDARQRSATWPERTVVRDESKRDRVRTRTAQTDDADAATARRRRNRHDRVVRRKHGGSQPLLA
ncbi:MAG: hypothetical protein AUI11_11970 [Acidobacteria bacterium 13_2_20CM_2_66_4]|nr:MAG: hypothetical protein AUI11_11970 [Acidobacteria bacterium 13_2_20CM_2_66_4]